MAPRNISKFKWKF